MDDGRVIGMGLMAAGMALDAGAIGLLLFGLGVFDGAETRPAMVGGAAFLFVLSSGAVAVGAMRLRGARRG